MGAAPEYRRVVRDVCARLRAGEIPVGSRLGSLAELSDRYGVSRDVARAAVLELRRLGVVITRQGAGTTVVAVPGLSVEDRLQVLEEQVAALTRAAAAAGEAGGGSGDG